MIRTGPELAADTILPFTNDEIYAFTPLEDLTLSLIGEDAQVRCSPGWWDADSSATDGTGGTGARIRTNQAGARVTIETTGFTEILVRFAKDHYSAVNADGEPWRPRPGFWRRRLTVDGVAGAWVYGERPTADMNGWLVGTGLDPDAITRIDMEPTHPVDPQNDVINSSFVKLEYMREPSVAPSGEHGAWHDIVGFITAGSGTFRTVTDSTGPFGVLLIGDSNMHGYVDTEVGQATVSLVAPGTVDTPLLLDARGESICWSRQLAEAVATAFGQRANVCNVAYGQLWGGVLSAASRASLIALQPGIASDPIDRVSRLTGYTNVTAPFVAAGRPHNTGFYPSLIIFSFVTNDQTYSVAGIPELGGTQYRDDIVDTINALHAAWPAARILAVNNQRPDSSVPGADAHARFAEALGVGYLDHAATDWLAYADIRALVSTAVIPDGEVHMTGTQHTAAATALLATANALVEQSLDFSFLENSAYWGLL